MAIYRLYTYDPPGSPFYKDPSQGGFLYNTGRFDSSQALGQGCTNPDAQGFNDFPSLLAYANQRGETLRGPVTRDFVNALCGGTITVDGSPIGGTAGPGAPTPSGGGTGGTGAGCSGSTCGPSGPTVTPVVQPTPSQTPPSGGVTATAPSTTTGVLAPNPSSGYGGGSPSPTGGSLGGGTTVQPVQPATSTTGTAVVPVSSGFDLVTFLKSPFGILILVLLIVILLTRSGA